MSDPVTLRLTALIAEREGDRLTIRRVVDADGPALTALVEAAYDEYACGPLDPEVFDADLARPGTVADELGRSWWVVFDDAADGALVGSMACGPLRRVAGGPGTVELHRLYLAPSVRGRGLATVLLQAMIAEASSAGADILTAWSDTRLTDAHHRYEALGFGWSGAQRELGDPAGTTELRFDLPLTPVQR